MKELHSPYLVDQEIYLRNQHDWDVFVGKLSNLENNARRIFFSADTPYFLEMLCLNSSLSEQQSAELSRVVRNIFLGDLFIGDLPATITQKLNIDPQTAQQISTIIINELFVPAIEDIKKMQREKFPNRVGQGNATPTLVPPPPPSMKNGPAVNQGNVIDLRSENPNH